MSASMPDWATLPEYIRQKLESHISAIAYELKSISNLGATHPQSALRMGTIKGHAQMFLDLINRIEGANNADFYAYKCRKEMEK